MFTGRTAINDNQGNQEAMEPPHTLDLGVTITGGGGISDLRCFQPHTAAHPTTLPSGAPVLPHQ